MQKEEFKASVKRVLLDRSFLFLSVSLILAGLIYCLIVLFGIQPSDAQVYSRYTGFGERHFYRDHWQYLILFAAFGAIVVTAHLALMIKLHNLGRRQTAMLIGFAGIVILFVATAYALSVLHLG